MTPQPLKEYSEALGQLGQDEPASGMPLEPFVAFAPLNRIPETWTLALCARIQPAKAKPEPYPGL